MIPVKDVPSSAIYPGFGPGRWPGEQLSAITIDSESQTKITEKIVRGILYLEESVFVCEDYEISTHVLHDQVAINILDRIAKHLVVHSREPGITVLRATVPEDKTSSVFAIEIWGRFRTYCIVTKRLDSTN